MQPNIIETLVESEEIERYNRSFITVSTIVRLAAVGLLLVVLIANVSRIAP